MTTAPYRSGRSRAALALPVLALHAVLLIGLGLAMRHALRLPPAPQPAPLVVRLLAEPRRETAVPVPPTATAAPSGGRRAAATRPSPQSSTGVTTAEPQSVPLPPQAAASAAAPNADVAETPLLDTPASRRALHALARSPLLSERAAAATDAPAPATFDTRLGGEVARSARGDCLKGEYAGAGMGLLSLPFLAAAALRDQCRR